MADMYSGGIPTPGKNLYPDNAAASTLFEPNNGPSNAKTSGSDSEAPGASFSGGEGDGLLKESGYHPMGEERVEGGLKIMDQNNIQTNA